MTVSEANFSFLTNNTDRTQDPFKKYLIESCTFDAKNQFIISFQEHSPHNEHTKQHISMNK